MDNIPFPIFEALSSNLPGNDFYALIRTNKHHYSNATESMKADAVKSSFIDFQKYMSTTSRSEMFRICDDHKLHHMEICAKTDLLQNIQFRDDKVSVFIDKIQLCDQPFNALDRSKFTCNPSKFKTASGEDRKFPVDLQTIDLLRYYAVFLDEDTFSPIRFLSKPIYFNSLRNARYYVTCYIPESDNAVNFRLYADVLISDLSKAFFSREDSVCTGESCTFVHNSRMAICNDHRKTYKNLGRYMQCVFCSYEEHTKLQASH